MSTVSDKVTAFFDSDTEVKDALDVAEGQAGSSFEIQFVEDMKARFERFGMEMFMSEKQFGVLTRLLNKQHR